MADFYYEKLKSNSCKRSAEIVFNRMYKIDIEKTTEMLVFNINELL